MTESQSTLDQSEQSWIKANPQGHVIMQMVFYVSRVMTALMLDVFCVTFRSKTAPVGIPHTAYA